MPQVHEGGRIRTGSTGMAAAARTASIANLATRSVWSACGSGSPATAMYASLRTDRMGEGRRGETRVTRQRKERRRRRAANSLIRGRVRRQR